MADRFHRNELDGGKYLTLHEFVKAAKQKLNANIWDYLIGGTETETTVARNRMAIDTVALRPRVLNDVSKVDASVDFFGHKIRLPVFCAPVGSLESFEPGGGATVARGAGQFGVPFMLSSVSQPGLEDAAAAATGPKVFQLYTRGDTGFIDDYARRAAAAGYDAFAMTVDTAHYSRRERDISKRFVKSWRAANVGMNHQAALNWEDVRRFKDTHKIPLILKGIGTAEDAALAVQYGVDVVYVSNHGGRQLDHGRGSMDVLREVSEAVAGRAKIMVDGGFCRGTDLVKALALGADWVGVGRLYLYALAADGDAGITNLFEILEDETIKALGLCGVNGFKELTKGHVHVGAPPVVWPDVHSAFPLLRQGY
ncbi:alpha-hydroxy-acid oxidizing protein [Rhodovarius crocodyli]|uniref:Alpha-hydroxy-acid oxidizing protein n=1 Tax=Rhodovarius crocodyli TaxID=1979269 RepID=A0A437MCD8_9PROT|nr:alpha-hydroxy acid oxidase [Rhodovarius crocodyli]RVT95309.1 alpha-hydroxy-acid oxidizing protein [Rhodovarius crocodyli]